MKSVMLSIQPKWCELIASGKKTVEVRKTKPKIDVPFKCYIYCTKGDNLNYLKSFHHKAFDKFWIDNKAFGCNVSRANGKVIGHFICDEIDNFTKAFFDEQTARDTDEIAELLGLTCLTYRELYSYVGLKDFYAWHITDLVIYDKPKELSEFRSYNVSTYIDEEFGLPMPTHIIKRPFQSWGYVEELKGETE